MGSSRYRTWVAQDPPNFSDSITKQSKLSNMDLFKQSTFVLKKYIRSTNGQDENNMSPPERGIHIIHIPLNNLKCYISMDSVKANRKRNKPQNSQKYYIHVDLDTMGNCYSVF